MTAIETERLLLRRYRPEDADAYYPAVYGDPDVMKSLSSGVAIPRAEFDGLVPARLARHWDEHGFGVWLVTDRATGEVLGHCGLRYWPDSTDVEVLYALARPAWGRGIATEAAGAALRWGFGTLGLDKIVAAAFVDNPASSRVLDKIGLRRVDVREFVGRPTVWFELTRAEYDGRG